MHRFVTILTLVLFITGCARHASTPVTDTSSVNTIRFMPIGDSYTIGEGVEADKIWPALLTARLREAGIAIDLIGNPARTGWTTQDALSKELPFFDAATPTFSTILLGVNDWVQGVDAETFHERFSLLLDRMLSVLPKNRLIVITIPDFSVTPTGKIFGDPAANAEGIRSFNAIIRDEAKKRALPVVDLFELSQDMGKDATLVTPDGLHPSAAEHVRWMEKILPITEELLTK